MNQLQMLKKAMIAYVNSVKFIWSAIAYPLAVIGSKTTKVKDYKIYGNSVQDGTPATDNPVEVQSVGELTTKNLWKGVNYIKSTGDSPVCIQYATAQSNDWVRSGVTVTVSATVCVNDHRTCAY